MQNTKRIIYFLFFMLLLQQAFAQNSITGNIRDAKTDKPLANVTVVLMRSDSTIIHYAYSEENGRFDLKKNGEGVWVRLSIIGYKSIQHDCSEIQPDHTFRMNPEVFKLREVRVTTERIREEGDTLTYLVSGFKMIQDRSIGDVLKKMPGIEVSEAGGIKFEGKPINRFYIEGLNLLDKRYQLGTKNIPVNAVKEVEILRNHQPIKALKDKVYSDQAALNLKLTDEAKSRWLFNLDLGLGFSPLLWKNRLMGMQFARKRQMIALYKNDNTGVDIESELDEVLLDNLMKETNGSEESIFPAFSSVYKPEAARNFSETHMLSVNNLNQFDKNTSLRTQINYINSKTDRTEQTETIWFLPDSSNISLSESAGSRFKRSELNTDLTYEKNGSAHFVKNKLLFAVNWNDMTDVVLERSSLNNEYYDLDKWKLGNEFSFVKHLNNRVWEFRNNTLWTRLPQSFRLVQSGQDTSDSDFQRVVMNNFSNDLSTSYGHTIGGFFVSYNLGWQLKYNDIVSGLTGSGFGSVLPVDSLNNDFRLFRSQLFVEPKINYESGGFKFRLWLKTSWLGVNEESRIQSGESKLRNYAVFEPNLHVSYDLSSKWKVSGGFNRLSEGTNMLSLLPNYLLKDYRTVQANHTSYGLNHHNIARLSLDYSDPIKAFFWKSSVAMTRTRQTTTLYDQFTGIVLTSYQVDEPSNVKQLSASTRLMKGFSWINLRTYLTLGYNQMEQQRVLTDVLTKMNRHTYRIGAELYAQPFKWLNLEYNFSAYWNNLNQTEPEKNHISTTFNHRHKLDLTFDINKRWVVRSLNSLFAESQMKKAILLSDLQVSFLYNKQEFGITLSNVFDTRNYYRNYISDFKEVSQIVQIRPRQLLFRYAFSF